MEIRCIFGERYSATRPSVKLSVGSPFEYTGDLKLINQASVRLVVVLSNQQMQSLGPVNGS